LRSDGSVADVWEVRQDRIAFGMEISMMSLHAPCSEPDADVAALMVRRYTIPLQTRVASVLWRGVCVVAPSAFASVLVIARILSSFMACFDC
jgi:hypothetical protein